jgi:anti-sigma regulatory factor (Ser/Thr protein kinase)
MGSNTSADQPPRSDGEVSQRGDATAADAADVLRRQQVFPGDERQLGALRRWLASLLPPCPARDDVLSVATELATNALQHTASGHGGWFAVEVTWYGSIVRVAVADGGGPAEPHVIGDATAEHGRGLLLVRGLSVRAGMSGDHHSRLVWAEIAWDGPNAAARGITRGPYDAVSGGQAALPRCCVGMPSWSGCPALAWWVE